MTTNPLFMRRALELAQHGRGAVSPNPMVGCVIVHDLGNVPTGRILAEGWHRQYGGPHAEVNAIRAVALADEALLPDSTAYVTLEPCSHFGKTPPCADLLIAKKVGRIVCCNDDPNPLVSGRGFARLRAAGIEVVTGLLAEEGRVMNARFFTFFEQRRPYIILKWAETADGFMGGVGATPVAISGALARRLVHRWRSEEDAIMVGTTTARNDNPRLNVRHWPGTARPDAGDTASRPPAPSWPVAGSPVRIVLDRSLALPADLHLFDGSQPTRVYHNPAVVSPVDQPNLSYVPTDSLASTLTDLHQQRIQSVLVEGGAQTLTAFMEAGLWDEIRLFRSPDSLTAGVSAPQPRGQLADQQQVGTDTLLVYRR